MPKLQGYEELLPLGAAAFHIMLVLADGERHGYAIMQDVAELTDGTISFGPGTLYRIIKQMVADGWIVEHRVPDDDDPRRRYYRLTPRGRRIAGAETQRLARLVAIARARRLVPA